MSEQVNLTLAAPDIRVLALTLIGDSPLICHAWSKKAKAQMLAKQMKTAAQKKEAKDPKRDYEESLYRHPSGGYGFPAVAFKSAFVAAARFTDMKMTELRGVVHVEGDLIRIDGKPSMREDMVRLGGMTADIRYRGEFRQWKVKLTLRYNARVISAEQIAALFNGAGFGVGVGEWRPERNGSFGRFHVASKKEAA